MMEKSRSNKWFLRIMAMVMAVGMIVGAVPASALDIDEPVEDESIYAQADEGTYATEEAVTDEQLPSQEETVAEVVEEYVEEEPTEAQLEQKDDAQLAQTALDPDDVKFEVTGAEYVYYEDSYTGISSINVTFPKPEGLSADDVKAVFSQEYKVSDGYDGIAWWNDVTDYKGLIRVTEKGSELKINLRIYNYVTKRYDSDFKDGKADGTYELIFTCDRNGDDYSLYSKKFTIDNAAPYVDTNCGSNPSAWRTTDAPVNYIVQDNDSGLDHAAFYKLENGVYQIKSDLITKNSNDTFEVKESGVYYFEAVDRLGNSTGYKYVGEFNIDKDPVTFGDSIKYSKAEPGSDEWVSEEVEAVFTVKGTTSGLNSVKIKGSSESVTDKGDGEYAVTFKERKAITVVATNKAGASAELEIAAPQIDNVKPDKDSIKKIGIVSRQENRYLNLLSFGLYSRVATKLTVYATDAGSPITEIILDPDSKNSDKVTKSGKLEYNSEGTAYQSFTILAQEEADDSDFSEIRFFLTDKAGNKSEQSVSIKDINAFTVDTSVEVKELDKEIGELVVTNIAPDIKDIQITADKEKDGEYFSGNIHITSSVDETLTGLEKVNVYLDKAEMFDAENNYKPFSGVKGITSKAVTAISTDVKTDHADIDYTVSGKLESGDYVLFIRAYNNAGNNLTAYRLFTIDKEAPVIELVSTPDEWTNSPDAKVVFSVTDKPDGKNTGVKTAKLDGEELTAADGSYSFTPAAGKTYKLDAEDNFENKAKTLEVSGILFDDQPPAIGPFTYSNNDNKEWKKEVTVSFTVDDKFNGETLSGIDVSSLALIKEDGTTLYNNINAEATEDGYSCSFEAEDNNAKYTVAVKDIAGNPAEAKTTEVVKRDDSEPAVEKIVFSSINTSKKYGLYGQGSIRATVYVKPGHTAPVADIKLYNDGKPFDPETDEIKFDEENNVYTKTFIIPEAEDGKGSVYDKLGAYAVSAAGVLAEKSGENGIVSIADINVYVGDTELKDKFKDFFEVVAKTSGPAVELKYEFSEINGVLGYLRDAEGKIEKLSSYSYTVKDDIAGINNDTVKVYFDKVKKYNVDENGDFVPVTEGDEDAKTNILDATEKYGSTDDSRKNTSVEGSYEDKAPIESGQYILYAQAENLSGKTKSVYVQLDVDNSAPKITDVTYSPVKDLDPTKDWVNGNVTVGFSVNDMPVGYCAGLDDYSESVTVIGNKNNASYKLNKDDNTGRLSFEADLAQTYTISAVDKFGIKSEAFTTPKILIDTEKPHISIVDLDSYKNIWSKDEKLISFEVDDLSEKDELKDDNHMSGVLTIKVSDGSLDYNLVETEVENTSEKRTYSFVANAYKNYVITVTDKAGNSVDNTELENIRVDTKNPVIEKVSFDNEDNETPIERVLHFLTFGIFGNEKVRMVVEGIDPAEAIDPAESSGVGAITVTFVGNDKNGKEKTTVLTAKTLIEEKKSTGHVVTKYVDVPTDIVSNSKQISVEIVDNVEHTTTKTLYDLFGENKLTIPDGFKIDGEDFEFIINSKAPKVEFTEIKHNDENKQYVSGDTYYFRDTDFTVKVKAEDDNSKLHGVSVSLNGTDITTQSYDAEDMSKLTKTYTDFDPSEVRNDTPVEKKNIIVNANELITDSTDENVENVSFNYISKVSGANTFTVVAQGNNGITTEVSSKNIFIDDIAPEITKFEFSGNGVSELSGHEKDMSETKEIDDAVAAISGITSDNYVYFFKDETKVKVTATDTHNGIDGSGVKEIHLIVVGFDGPDEAVTTNTIAPDSVKENSDGDLTASFTIPANFKGSLYAYATDNVGNDVNNSDKSGGKYYNPHNLIVENYDLHKNSSGAAITVDNTNYVSTDNENNPLYDGNVDVTLTIEDRYSGLKSVDYSFSGIRDSARYSGSVSVDINGNVTDSNGASWNIEETNKNLVLKISRTITLNAANDGAFNSNRIEMSISGIDRSGYAIEKKENTISIDTTKPRIVVTYDPAAGSGNTYGTDEYEYFSVSRTMTVTVYERNFDPSDFDRSGIVNNYVTGDVPALSAGANWSTSYDNFTDESQHVATFTFANDGDYDIKLNYTDEAENKADEYTGEKFTIDTIDPTVEISMSGTAKNDKYYNETVTATVTVNEHNFAEGDTYVTFTPTTDFDTSYDSSSASPSLSSWSSSGDTHTATVEFSSDGTYSFTFDYKDKSLRSAQQKTQSEFVIDKNIDKAIKFVDVENTVAYDGVIAPKVEFDDTNLDSVTTKLSRISLDTEDSRFPQDKSTADNLKHSLSSDGGSSRTDAYENFPVEVGNDGIYILEASATDLAGNATADSDANKIMFSVNRFGSTFMLSSDSAEWLEKGYIDGEQELEVIEINVTEIEKHSVSISHNSQNKQLAVSEFECSKTAGDNESWYRYDYDIYKSNFEDEGNYIVTLTSVDEFDKTITNRTAYNDEDNGIVKNCPISFVVDKTAPSILIEGIKSDTPYGDPERTVQIICTDTNIDPDSLVIKDEADNVLQEGTDYTLEELAGELDIELTVDKAGKHSLSVSVDDLAANKGENAVTDYQLNASIFTLFFHNTVAVIVSGAVLAALVGLAIFLILRKRKDQPQ